MVINGQLKSAHDMQLRINIEVINNYNYINAEFY
jgi:hypothetical protein